MAAGTATFGSSATEGTPGVPDVAALGASAAEDVAALDDVARDGGATTVSVALAEDADDDARSDEALGALSGVAHAARRQAVAAAIRSTRPS